MRNSIYVNLFIPKKDIKKLTKMSTKILVESQNEEKTDKIRIMTIKI